jgi:hypothetical protein
VSPKTDLPEAELPRIRAANQAAVAGDRQAVTRYDEASLILLLTAWPLPGPILNVTAWATTRVVTSAGRRLSAAQGGASHGVGMRMMGGFMPD